MNGNPSAPGRKRASGLCCCEKTMAEKINIGISSCLLGNPVRYDGGHRLNRALVKTLGKRFDLMPVCPEMEAGLSVPREAMELFGTLAMPRLRVAGSTIDLTGVMTDYAKKKVRKLEKERICGFVFKNRSPSCAVDDAVIITARGRKNGPGLFRQLLSERLPGLPVADEEELVDPARRKRFIERVLAYQLGAKPLTRLRV